MTIVTDEKSAVRPSDTLSTTQLLGLLRSMMLIRRFEERCAQSYQQAKIGGFCHLYVGQEAVSVGSIAALQPDDPIITAYRDHGHALARGMHPNHAMAEMFGKVTGCAKGKGGSMHLFDKYHHMYGGHAIVGGQCPLGAGIAFAVQYLNEAKVCVCYLGDGALNQGAFHESLNLSAVWKLPVVWVCENNLYSMGTAIDRGTSMANNLSVKAAAYGISHVDCDGMDVLGVYDCFKPLVEGIRQGQGPVFVNVKTYRYKGHSMSDPQKYRSKEEVVLMQEEDPINRLVNDLIDRGAAGQDDVDQLDREAKRLAMNAVRFANESADTPQEELYTDVYVNPYGPFKKGVATDTTDDQP